MSGPVENIINMIQDMQQEQYVRAKDEKIKLFGQDLYDEQQYLISNRKDEFEAVHYLLDTLMQKLHEEMRPVERMMPALELRVRKYAFRVLAKLFTSCVTDVEEHLKILAAKGEH